MRNIFGWMGMREQQRALEASQQHMEQVRQVVHLLKEALDQFAAGNLERVREIHEQVTAAEREADELRRDLLDQLSEGMFLPADREDLVHMVERTDDVADYANAASRLLVLFQEAPPEELREDLVRFGQLLVRAVEQLAQALDQLLDGQRRETLRLCTAVERCEEEGDALKASLYRRLLALDLPAGALLLLHDLIEAMENTADRAEDSADLVRVLAVKLR
ncbi:MAG: TIGR00153 family protein [Limnochordales bacterium]|nr:TIGR00153 family protein [Limnochordales bacterium]